VAAKVKKRYGSRRRPRASEAAAATQVEEKLAGLWEWIRRYRYILSAIVVVLFVVAVAGTLVGRHLRAREAARQAAFDAILEAVRAPVVADPSTLPPDAPDTLRFPSEEEKYEAVVARAESFLADHDEGVLAEHARLLAAAARAHLGQWKESAPVVQAYLDAHPDGPMAPFLRFELAAARAAEQGAAAAAETLEPMRSSPDWFWRAEAALRATAPLASGKVDAAQADAMRKWLDAALELLTAPSADLVAVDFLKSELERRRTWLP